MSMSNYFYTITAHEHKTSVTLTKSQYEVLIFAILEQISHIKTTYKDRIYQIQLLNILNRLQKKAPEKKNKLKINLTESYVLLELLHETKQDVQINSLAVDIYSQICKSLSNINISKMFRL